MTRIRKQTLREEFVYFIMEIGTSFVKIGWTTTSPWARLNALQGCNPHKLELLGYYPGTRDDEQALHFRFQDYRVRGEWFLLENSTIINRGLLGEIEVARQYFLNNEADQITGERETLESVTGLISVAEARSARANATKTARAIQTARRSPRA